VGDLHRMELGHRELFVPTVPSLGRDVTRMNAEDTVLNQLAGGEDEAGMLQGFFLGHAGVLPNS